MEKEWDQTEVRDLGVSERTGRLEQSHGDMNGAAGMGGDPAATNNRQDGQNARGTHGA